MPPISSSNSSKELITITPQVVESIVGKSKLSVSDSSKTAKAVKLSEVITGIIGSERPEQLASVGRLATAAIKSQFRKQLCQEIEHFTKIGKIQSDSMDNANGRVLSSFIDILNYVDGQDELDVDRMNAIRALFLAGMATNIAEQELIMINQMIQTIKNLDVMDILIMKECYSSEPQYDRENRITISHSQNNDKWIIDMARKMGLVNEMIYMHIKHLEREYIVNKEPEQGIYTVISDNSVLSRYGAKICEYLEKVEKWK